MIEASELNAKVAKDKKIKMKLNYSRIIQLFGLRIYQEEKGA